MNRRATSVPAVRVREHRLPHGGRLFSVTLSDGTLISIDLEPASATRRLSVTPPGGDTATARVTFRDQEATVVAAILSGMRFVVEGYEEYGDHPVRAINLRTVTIGPASPAVGRRLAELEGPVPGEAQVIGVIREETPDLIERDPSLTCQPGDRLVVVGKPGAMTRIVRFLLGESEDREGAGSQPSE